MKILNSGLALSLALSASAVTAQQLINVDGKDYPLFTLMEECQKITGDSEAQVACFGNITKLLNEQSGQEQQAAVSVPDAVAGLKAVAEYQDNGSGLLINATECKVQFLYFDNYFHISRRNISAIDLFSTELDLSEMPTDQIAALKEGTSLLSKAEMRADAVAIMRGGAELESSQNNFKPRSPKSTIVDYAVEVAGQLPARESQTAEFVMVHPKHANNSAEIWTAFETLVKACR